MWKNKKLLKVAFVYVHLWFYVCTCCVMLWCYCPDFLNEKTWLLANLAKRNKIGGQKQFSWSIEIFFSRTIFDASSSNFQWSVHASCHACFKRVNNFITLLVHFCFDLPFHKGFSHVHANWFEDFLGFLGVILKECFALLSFESFTGDGLCTQTILSFWHKSLLKLIYVPFSKKVQSHETFFSETMFSSVEQHMWKVLSCVLSS